MRRLILSVTFFVFLLAGSAQAARPSPGFTIGSYALPTNFSTAADAGCQGAYDGSAVRPPDVCNEYEVTITNSGGLPTDGSAITVTDTLPSGVTPVLTTPDLGGTTPAGEVAGFLYMTTGVPINSPLHYYEELGGSACSASGQTIACRLPAGKALAPDAQLDLEVLMYVDPGVTGSLTNAVTVSGGGAPAASASVTNQIDDTPELFGVSRFSNFIAGLDGQPDTQAGDHPYELSTQIDLDNRIGPDDYGHISDVGSEDVKDVVVDLPLGFLGDALATPTCTFAQLSQEGEEGVPPGRTGCPADTQVGMLRVEPFYTPGYIVPVFNMVAEKGVAAEYGFQDPLAATHVLYASVAPSPSGYVLQVTAPDIPQVGVTAITTTFFGSPAVKAGSSNAPVPQFTNPADCSGQPAQSTVWMDSWQHPASFNPDGTPDLEGPGSSGWAKALSDPAVSPALTGCDLLSFQPSGFAFAPETTTADTPTGATFDLKLPQPESPGTLATPPLRDATVTLPPGLTLDPAAAGGLQACTEAQIGWLGPDNEQGEPLPNHGYTHFTEASPEASEREEAEGREGVPGEPAHCPKASKVGSVEVSSPLIATKLEGSVYLASENENPYHSLLAGYVVIDDPTTGTVVKIPGELSTNPETGQITGTFDENPQLPFSDLKIHFTGGPRGDLATPEACGTYTTNADFKPWSAPDSGPDATPSDSFEIDSGCVSAFTPAFSAGTTSNQAGSFSPFVVSIGREDDEQGLGGLTVNLPTGLVGKIAAVAECSEAQVAAAQARSAPGQGAVEQASPSCPESSLLGTVTTQTGPGPLPYSVTGHAYLTGPYKGAPYGMAIIVPAVAGPFDLGVVVIRQALFINPTDAHVTDVSDPFPTIRDGIPLRIQRVNVNLNRPNFTLNPTSCETKSITGTATSTTGTPAALSAHYQAAGCASLPFTPEFSASTDGKTSKANGASLKVRIGFPTGGQANIHKVELEIPRVLPSRLTTLQKACTEAQFNANPAGCPSASVIATAIAHTPLLPDPLVGPVYFVSHGGAAFPDTEMVLQGDNVTLVVVGHTDIKKGITYSRFETVPDAPVTSFEFNGPEGPYSIFASNVDLCQVEVRMPTTITAQNGAILKEDTLIEPEGCPNKLTILSHTVKGRGITLTVVVPGAGKLTATGRGLSKPSKTAGGRGTVTLTLKATRRGNLNTKVKLTFVPTKGKHLSASVSAKFKR